MQPTAKAYLAALGAVTIWGMSFVATKVALTSFPPYSLLTARFLLAGGLLALLWIFRSRERIHGRDLGLFFLLGIMDPGLYFVCETYGLLRTSASVASLIIASIPVFVALLASVFLKERTGLQGAMGILLTLAGVGLLVKNGADPAASSSLAGNLLILGAALCAAVYTVVSRTLGGRYGAVTVTTLQAFFAVGFFLPFAVGEWDGGWVHRVSTQGALAVGFLGLFASLGAFLLYNRALGSLPASSVAVFINLIPVVTVMTAWLVLGERLSAGQVGGGLLVVVGVVLSARGRAEAGSPWGVGLRRRLLAVFLKRGGAYGGFSLASAEQHVKGPGAPVPGAGAGKGEHEAL